MQRRVKLETRAAEQKVEQVDEAGRRATATTERAESRAGHNRWPHTNKSVFVPKLKRLNRRNFSLCNTHMRARACACSSLTFTNNAATESAALFPSEGGGELITSWQNATLLFQDNGTNDIYSRKMSGGGGDNGGGTWLEKKFEVHGGDLNNELNFWT